MSVRTRATLDVLRTYRPGRTTSQVARERGVQQAVRLSANESSFGPLPSVAAAVAEAASEINRYPDFHASALRTAVGERFGFDPVTVVTGCGSAALYRNFVEAVAGPGDEVLVAEPTFEVFAAAAVIAGARPVAVPLRAHLHDLDEMAAAITRRTRAVVVCNPNNPTSTAVGGTELNTFLERVPEDVLVVLDQAYHDFDDSRDPVDGAALVRRRPNVAVLRTFSKAHGLASLRVGYGIVSPTFADVLRKVVLPFAVSGVAEAAAVASLRPEAESELADRVAATRVERERVSAALRVAGYDVPVSRANFVWLPLGAASAGYAAACEDRGVIVRAIGDAGVRVTVGLPAENDRFLAVAAELATTELVGA
jgi:histidinol-phosphate aminotransferase